MALNINGSTGISGIDGSASAPALQGTDSNTGINFASDTVNINTAGTTRAIFNNIGDVGLGVSPTNFGTYTTLHLKGPSGQGSAIRLQDNSDTPNTDDFVIYKNSSNAYLRVNGSDPLNVYKQADNATSCIITNNGTTGGHCLKITSGSTGTGTKLLEVESHNQSSAIKRFAINADGWFHFGAHSYNSPAAQPYNGAAIGSVGFISANRESDLPMELGRTGTDGTLVRFYHAGTQEGNIAISGTSVSYNGGHLSRWSQIKGLSQTDKSARPTIYQGTVMSNLDDLCEWEGEENQQLNMTKISEVEGDKDVAGVFWAWDDDDKEIVNDFYIAMTGDMVIRVAASTTVARGDLLISAGDGTAKPQADDIVRSSTIAKIISTISTATYADGSKAYPCVLMAC